MVALGCIDTFITAEELDEPYKIKDDVKLAVEVDGDFAWEALGREAQQRQEEEKKAGGVSTS